MAVDRIVGVALAEFAFAYGPVVPTTVTGVEDLLWMTVTNHQVVSQSAVVAAGPGQEQTVEFTGVWKTTGHDVHGIFIAGVGPQVIQGSLIQANVEVWAAGVELVMEELGSGDLLPGRIYLCGGGSRLPEIVEALRAERFWKRLSFARPPEVVVMAPDQIETITDATDLLVDQQDVTPLGLAYQAIELQSTEDPLDAALRRVLRAMKV